MNMTRLALAAVLMMGTASAALAQDGARAKSTKRYSTAASAGTMQPASKRPGVDASMPGANLMMNVMDRASSPFACGG